jgi:hypothetical protein
MADEDMDETSRPHGEVSIVAVPLAGKKLCKRLYKVSKKAAASKILKRGVKEVVKALRKSDGFKGCVAPHCAARTLRCAHARALLAHFLTRSTQQALHHRWRHFPDRRHFALARSLRGQGGAFYFRAVEGRARRVGGDEAADVVRAHPRRREAGQGWRRV